MKVLLLGGTGAMGVHLASLLNENKIDTFVTTRKERKDYGTVHYLVGNAHNDEFLLPILDKENFDVVVDFMVYNTEEFSNRAEKLLDSCGQYVFLSSSRVYADSKNSIKEDSPRLLDVSDDKEFLETDEYALTKARQENILFKSEKKNWTIIRPYITYSEIRLQLGVLEKELWLNRALSGKTVVFSKDIFEHYTTLTWGEDVSRGIKALLGKQEAFEQTFHITQAKALKWSEIWNIYSKVLTEETGKKPEIKLIDLPAFHEMYSGKYQINYDRLYDRVFDNSKISQFVDTKKFLSPEEGLEKSLREFIKNGGHFDFVSWASEGFADRISGEHYSLLKIQGLKNKLRYGMKRLGLNIHRPSFLKKK